MTGPIGRPAPERALLCATGAQAREVLQGVVSNDVSRLAPGRALYAALLTPQGKYLFDFFLVAGEGADSVLIDVAADRAAALRQRLGMYCLRRDARIAPSEGLEVALLWGTEAAPEGAVRDPRAPGLGWRIYGPDAAAALAAAGARPAGPDDYLALRLAHGVPETGIELMPDETYILEAGFERLNGVDFRKGCFVGQEVTARMKHKAELRKRLVTVQVEGEAEPGTPILADGKPAGTLFSHQGGTGLAHLRLDRASGPMQAGAATVTFEG